MKETNVWLSPEDLKYMLQGSLLWSDVTSRVSKPGIRKLGESILDKQRTPKQTEQPENLLRELGKPSQRLEGKPVIWLLGSVGLLTLSSWFYFVLFAQ